MMHSTDIERRDALWSLVYALAATFVFYLYSRGLR